MTPIIEWCRSSKRCSPARLQLTCLILGVCVSACGSSGGGQQPGLGVGDHAGGASGQNAGGAGTGGTRTTGMGDGSGSSGAGADSSAGAAGKGGGSWEASGGGTHEGGSTNGGSGASSGISGQADSGTGGVGTCSRTDSTCPAGLSCHCCPTPPRQDACTCTTVCQSSATCSGKSCLYNFCAEPTFCATG